MMNTNLNDDFGVSPVIGVVLMVAITVALVTLVTVVVFNIQSDSTEDPSASTIRVSDGQTVTLIRQGDRAGSDETFEVKTDGATVGVLEDIGDTVTIPTEADYQVIRTRNGETVDVVRSIDSEDLNVDSTATLDGTDSNNLQSTITIGKIETGTVSP
jgi:flagellin-like protein